MSKITADHLARSAYVYVRQSTPGQVHRNHESRRRQYGLAERATQLGWSDVVVVDDDLAISGNGVKRPGFERLLVAICEGQVGTVLTIEASRLARNGRDWHTLLEFCGLVNCLIIDEDGLYDPRLPNDRLLLGMKGTMSEMELSLFRQRVSEARMLKAKRGELFTTIAVGYRKVAHEDQIEKEPDQRVQRAITLVFKKFAELQSIRQVHRWLRQEGIALPNTAYGPQGRHVVWKLPSYQAVYGIMMNPTYAGAYAYGRNDNQIDLKIHWQGGDHTQLNVRKARSGEHRWILDAPTTDIIRELARHVPDYRIASILNRAGKRTGRDNSWNEARVRAFRSNHGIEVYRLGERGERGEVNELEAAQVLGTCRMTVHRLIKRGLLKAQQACQGAPWVIKVEALAAVKIGPRGRSVTSNPDQQTLQF